MGTSLRVVEVVAVLAVVSIVSGAARADQVGSIRLTDRGPFQVWNGADADVPGGNARVLAVIGPTKSLRVSYSASMAPPQISVGRGWVDVVAGPGTAMTFAGRDRDCYINRILSCTNRPIQGVPSGAILCMCVMQEDTLCCTSDTGIYTDSMVPREGAY
jgi:hypothetical protein